MPPLFLRIITGQLLSNFEFLRFLETRPRKPLVWLECVPQGWELNPPDIKWRDFLMTASPMLIGRWLWSEQICDKGRVGPLSLTCGCKGTAFLPLYLCQEIKQAARIKWSRVHCSTSASILKSERHWGCGLRQRMELLCNCSQDWAVCTGYGFNRPVLQSPCA